MPLAGFRFGASQRENKTKNMFFLFVSLKVGTLRQSNIAMENPPFEDVFPIQDGDFPLLCLFTGGYSKARWFEWTSFTSPNPLLTSISLINVTHKAPNATSGRNKKVRTTFPWPKKNDSWHWTPLKHQNKKTGRLKENQRLRNFGVPNTCHSKTLCKSRDNF